MPQFAFSARPLFRSNAADQRHGAVIAKALAAAGEAPTPTKVLRHALKRAAMELTLPTIPDEVVAKMFPPRAG